MENFFDKKLKKIVIVNLILLALFLAAQSFSTFSDIFLRKKLAEKTSAEFLNSRSITFSATASVQAKPDIANFVMTVREESNDVVSAQQKMTDKSNKAIELLAAQGVDKKDIQTKKYDTRPKYSQNNILCVKAPCEIAKPTLIGYEATQKISFKVRDVSKAGDIVTALATLEISDVRGPDFDITDSSEFAAQAQVEAIKKAKEKAKKTAKDLGVNLGKIISFSENQMPYRPYMESAKGFAAMSSPNMEAGENEVSSTVSITYEIL